MKQPSNPIDQYPQRVVWSAEDGAFVGYCPAFFCGGVCHAPDPVSALRALRQLIAGEIARYREEGLPLPRRSSRAGITVKVQPRAVAARRRRQPVSV